MENNEKHSICSSNEGSELSKDNNNIVFMEEDNQRVTPKRKYNFHREKSVDRKEEKRVEKKFKSLPVPQLEISLEEEFHFLSFPAEIILCIFSFLPYYDVSKYSAVCGQFKKLLNDDYFWQTTFNTHFGGEKEIECSCCVKEIECSCWKQKTKNSTLLLANQFTWSGLEIDSQEKAEGMLQIASKSGFPSMIRRIMTLYPNIDLNVWYPEKEANKPSKTLLYMAAQQGNTNCCAELVSFGATVDLLCPEDNSTSLFIAVFSGSKQTIEFLVEKGANVNHIKTDQTTPLMIATRKSNSEVVSMLLRLGADANILRNDGIGSLYISCWLSNSVITRILLDEGKADPNVVPLVGTTTTSPLYVAAFGNKLEIATLLLQRGASVDIRQVDGSTALYIAAFNGFEDMLKLLHSYKANLNHQRNDGMSPLAAAVQNNQLNIIPTILKLGATVNQLRNDGATPIFIASRKGQSEALSLLIEGGANVNQARYDGVTPLNIASQNNRLECVRLLIEHGADLNLPEQLGVSPLIIASQQGNLEITKLLLEGRNKNDKANIDQLTNDQTSALFLASQQGHDAIVNLLIENGANINQPRNNGETALHAAVFKNHPSIVKILLERGANPSAQRNDGVNPLMLSVHSDCMDITRMLLRYKAEIDIGRSSDGTTALLYSWEIGSGRKHFIPLLLAYGASILKQKNNGKCLKTLLTEEPLEDYQLQAEEIRKSILENEGSMYI